MASNIGSSLLETLRRFTDSRSEEQLRALDAAIQELDPESCSPSELRALLGVLERFPEHDGFEVFWSIVHALEACDGYEVELLASVERMPCELNISMVRRLLDAGITDVGGRQLEGVLRSVIENTNATTRAVDLARDALARRKKDGV